MNPLIVRGAPQEYQCQDGAWQTLPEQLAARRIKRVLILHGKASWQAAQATFPTLENIYTVSAYYGGECSRENIQKIATLGKQEAITGIIAVGGGKIADLGKAVAYQLDCKLIILPTLAATCAAYTPLSVIYNQAGVMECFEYYPQATSLVLIEPKIILRSPISFMIAGIGDTLAKWYEADTLISQLPQLPIPVSVAHFAAKKCRDTLMNDSLAALQSMKEQELSTAFLNVLETNILLAGMVGGFGDAYGRTAGAHSIHDALTLIPESHQILHGNKVAYGILVQLALEEKWSEIDALLPFYQSLALPTCLSDMGLSLTEEEYRKVATRGTAQGEPILLMKETITPETLIIAMKKIETYAK